MLMSNFSNTVFYKSAGNMAELPDNSVRLVVTSPPYFNIKDYSRDGHQSRRHSARNRLFSFVEDLVLDPFAGSGTTLKVAKALGRRYVGYEIYSAYRSIIESKLLSAGQEDMLRGFGGAQCR